jgi:hypothetical protein
MTEPAGGASRIEDISTRASALNDPAKLVLRYGRAVRKYLGALLPGDRADDVSQDLLLEILQKGLARKDPGRGRFRDYLKAVARNVALDSLRRRPGARTGVDLADLPAERVGEADSRWLAEWRACVLDMAWTALEMHEYRHPEGHCHAVLRLAAEHPQENSGRLAARLANRLGHPVRPDAFRKALSRARRLFARLVLEQVRQTLDDPSPRRLEEELIEVGLMPYVGPYLPPGWAGKPPGAPA